MPELRQSKRSGKSSFRTRSSSTTPTRRSLGFSSPPTASAVSLRPPSLSPAHDEPPTDRVLTFLQSARDRNVPVRFGKWSSEEDAYLAKLIWLFESGLVADMEPKASLRSFLALMLNCCPMRISKKQMHGHSFVGKTKYAPRASKMTQQQYEQLCYEVWALRDGFLKAWAKQEYARRSSSVRPDDTSFQSWYDNVLALVPTPKLAKRSSLKECKKKRRIESLDELKLQVQHAKRQELDMAAKIRPVALEQEQVQEPERETSQVAETSQIEMLEPVEILPLEPALTPPESVLLTSYNTAVTALPTAYCSETVSMGDWLATSDRGCAVAQWTDWQSASHVGEARYTYCEDQVQVSVHLADQQTSAAELSMMRRSSRLIIDFGAPSGWHTGEEPKRTSFMDYSQWPDSDLTEELAMQTEPGIFGWDDSTPAAPMAYSPPMNFL
ncbi:hypothetical protein PHYPSEUDO_006486 [Phytophthora pseudosyringae]|uniref:Uncharacterized protein n=1 Tax=Phytophthora pseudosyringae TaxID=221518 RepID=A0A8T1VIL7_9STRA|nr:hypothetical protein PHYPSEUDO_006486 [Phytophthora pseudosyringae]